MRIDIPRLPREGGCREEDNVQKARAIYDHVLMRMTYDKRDHWGALVNF